MAERPTTSTRDFDQTHDALQSWLVTKLPAAAEPTISELHVPPTNGMSSETLLFEATWTDGGERDEHGLVARVPPDPANFPVFPTYDIAGQFTTMTLVRQLTDVPVPEPLWVETDPSVLGQPFFVMRRVDGLVPPDVMPYAFGGNWLYDASPAEQDRLAESSLQVLADLHAIPEPEKHFGFLHDGIAGDTPLRRHYQQQIVDYYAWAAQETPAPLMERCFQWLEDHWPADEGPTVLSWGDARIGNVLYEDFEPAAVLDWEMASLGPREIDLGWFNFMHEFFHDTATKHGMPGMPDFLRRDDCVARYERLTGHTVHDIDWFSMLAATRYGVVSLRTGIRGAHFDGAPMPDDVDDLLMHRTALEALLEGTYWEGR